MYTLTNKNKSVNQSNMGRLTYTVIGLRFPLHLAKDQDRIGVQVEVNPEPGVTGILWGIQKRKIGR